MATKHHYIDDFMDSVNTAEEAIQLAKKVKLIHSKGWLSNSRRAIGMSIFDALGFLAHYLVILPVILQEGWQSGIDWDEVIADRLHGKWEEGLNRLSHLREVEVPRCYSLLSAKDDVIMQPHIFVDANELAMTVVGYFRFCPAAYFRST